MESMEARVLVSLSGIEPGTLRDCAGLATELDRRQVPLSLLFAPSGEHAVLDWVRERTCRGDSLLLHGYDHRVTPGHRINLGRRAEFAALPAHEARLRIIAATAALDHAGLTADGFAPPRWRGSLGTQQALRERGFRLCADLAGVHDLRTSTVYRARVQEFTPGGRRTETVRCFALVLAAARAARRGGLVRLGMAASDLVKPGPRQAFLDAIDVAVENGAVGATYATLMASPRGATSTSVPFGARLVNNP